MANNPVFQQARNAFSPTVVETLTGSPGAYWDGGATGAGEFWTRNPTREDRSIGSFHVSGEGTWYDHATGEGGDLIDLVAARDGCTLAQAAEKIVKAAGGVTEKDVNFSVTHNKDGNSDATATPPRKSKPKPVTPIPETARAALNQITKASRRGKPVAGWRYTDHAGQWLFSVVRYDADSGGKQVIPYYWTGSEWREGQVSDRDRPLYGLDRLSSHPDLPVLVVEGEKCADVTVPGHVVVTWPGGSSAVSRADWSPLAGRDVTIWPDSDEAGRKAATAISTRLPNAEVLDIWTLGKPDGWDIADATEEGMVPVDVLDSTPRVGVAQDNGDNVEPAAESAPFRSLGYSDDAHHFLIDGDRVVYAIPRGRFGASQILALAPLAWWAMQGCVSDQGSVKVAIAQDLLQEMSSRAGRFDEMSIRGAGVWRDSDRVVINDGHQLIAPDGTRTAYRDFGTRHHYVSSSTTFGDIDGDEATADDGRALMRLWQAQQWVDDSHGVASLGWSLMAPFGGVLQWRPHIWVSGRKGTGKSWVLENLITPLVGDFAHEGSGKDTEAGIRRIVRRDARPVILDEMEPRTKNDRDNIDRILALARNASSNHSARVTMAARDGGTESFVIRSAFCFASVQIPDVDAAVSSRIIRCELDPQGNFTAKKTNTAGLISAIERPKRYRLRLFRRLPRILDDIDWARRILLPLFGDQRQADQWAPLAVATWHLHRDDSIDCDAGRGWVEGVGRSHTIGTDPDQADEDAVWSLMLSHVIEFGQGDRRTVGEALQLADPMQAASGDHGSATMALGRFGLRILDREINGVSRRVLAVAAKASPISGALAGTPYQDGYGAQVKRHDLCIDGKQAKIRMTGQNHNSYLLDWDGFVERYLADGTD